MTRPDVPLLGAARPERSPLGPLLAIWRLLSLLCTWLLMFPMLYTLRTIGTNVEFYAMLMDFYRYSARCWGLATSCVGELTAARPLLVVSNHVSYLDVLALGGHLPVSFTPKSEIAEWPVAGTLARLANCVFVDRRRQATVANREHMRDAMLAGRVLVLFPEGTTGDGLSLLPFRTSFFSLAEGGEEGIDNLPVQPVTIAYHERDGSPLTPERMRRVSWIGDDVFFSHLWRYLQMPPIAATTTVHPPVTIDQFSDRKQMAAHCRDIIAGALPPVHDKKAPPFPEAQPNNGG